MKAPKRILIDEIYIDRVTEEGDELIMLKKLHLLCRKIKPNYERVVVQIWDEEVVQEKGGTK